MISTIVTLLTTAIGAFIGTLYGSKKLNEYQQSGRITTRKTALKAVDILKKYSGQPYSNVQSDFNTSLSISEKRAILVALHKLGIPILVPSSKSFQISDVQFSDTIISEEELESISSQIEKGNCDYLFYEDVENHFSSNLRLNTLRELAKRYVKHVMKNSRYENGIISNPNNWATIYFTPGEVQAILVFHYRVSDSIYYEDNGNLKSDLTDKLITEIEIGLWDNYLFWDYAAHQNVQNQNILTSIISGMLLNPQQNKGESSGAKEKVSMPKTDSDK